MADICGRLRSEEGILEEIAETTLLCLDDIGLRSPSDAAYDILHAVMTARRRNPTVITGNLSPVQLAKLYDDRIASRLAQGTVLELCGADRRLETTRILRINQ